MKFKCSICGRELETKSFACSCPNCNVIMKKVSVINETVTKVVEKVTKRSNAKKS